MLRLLFVSAAVALAACQRDAPAPHADNAHADPGAMDHGAPTGYTDVRFLDHMTAHHQMALDMAEMAETRAGSGDVRALAREIVAAQRAEIDSMASWRARWFDGAPAPEPVAPADMAAMGMAGMDMDALAAATGADFDRRFQEQMIPHHAGAVTMAAEAQLHTRRDEIRRLAAGIIAAQAREIGEMQARLDAAAPAADV